jgi:NAD(P)-dependent dehydrogenase (short-subunit alcohol dehydrogenase family)
VVDPSLPDLSGTVTVLTGASGGIGAGVSRRFAAAGAALVLGYRSAAGPARALAAEIVGNGGQAVAAAADVTDPDECASLMAVAGERFGRLDAVVGCAGVQPVAPLPELTAAEWHAVTDVDLAGAFHTVQAAAAVLGARGGSITLIASVEGSRPARGHAHYASAKAGMIMLARSAALEYGAAGIRVNTVSPGLVERPGLEEQWPEGVARWRGAAPLGRLGRPEDIGDATVFLASPLARWITGHDLVVDGGMGVAPAW